MIISFDSETRLIRPGCTAPEMACLTWCSDDEPWPCILHARDAFDTFKRWLQNPGVLLTGANVSFDMAVAGARWPELVDFIFKKYEDNLVTDVQTREKLLDIADGKFQGYHTDQGEWLKPKYSLADIARKYGVHLDKPEMVLDPATGKKVPDPAHCRLRFGELIPYPVNEWDIRGAQACMKGPRPTLYAMEDATANMVCHLAQEPHRDPFLRLEYEMARRAWVLYLASAWGLRTEPALVAKLEQRAVVERDRMAQQLREHGLVRPDGTRDTKLAATLMRDVCYAAGLKVPLTKTGTDCVKTRGMSPQEIAAEYTSLSEDACDMTGDPLLELYADYTRLGTVINKDVKALKQGTTFPIHTRYDIVATGRTSSSKPNCQNWGREVGPRECFVPRLGHVFGQADYEGLELRTLAQVCVTKFGASILANLLNSGLDPHLKMGADMLGITYEEAKARKKLKDPEIDSARQTGKVANFGFPGGLGAEKLSMWARKTYDVVLSVERAKELKKQWLTSFPEMELYFAWVNSLCANPKKMADIEVPISGWLRGDATYCAACNTPFQNLGAAAAGRGSWYLSKACYTDRTNVLFGSRPVLHIHDEWIVEVKDDALAHEKALEISRLMVKGANELLPDVPATAPPLLMKYWSKQAFELKDRNKRLVPWDGQWYCDCGKCFEGPAPTGTRSDAKCEFHTREWVA